MRLRPSLLLLGVLWFPLALQSRPETASQAAPQAAQQNAPRPNPPAQSEGKPASRSREEAEFTFHKDVEEVVLHATVLDGKQRIVNTLTRDAFTVYEDGQPQTITSFRREDIPVSLGVVIDNSGSMKRSRTAVNQATFNLVKASNPKDEVFVVNFNDEFWLDQDFTSDIGKLKDALERIESRGGTALYDALIASADHMKKNAKLGKRVLLVVTDGEDNQSAATLEQAIRRVQDNDGPTVYSIGIFEENPPKRAKRALRAFAEQTGGISYFPDNLEEVDSITKAVAHDIRNQYTIGYKPGRLDREGYRAVRVEAKARGFRNLQVRTRSGYYVAARVPKS
ncbi:MAG: VWA domain-containing protein [Acidobacteria bacterium]|nr:VWA domain-containing protein [Acidobacteriota bacterium]